MFKRPTAYSRLNLRDYKMAGANFHQLPALDQPIQRALQLIARCKLRAEFANQLLERRARVRQPRDMFQDVGVRHRGLNESLGRHRQRSNPLTRGVEDGVAHRRRQAHNRRFARSRRRQILAIHQHRLDHRQIAEARHAILREMRIQNAAVRKFHRFKQRAADGHHHRAFNLVFQMLGIHYRAALKRRHHAIDPHFRGRGRHFGAQKFARARWKSRAHVATYPPFSTPQARPTPRFGSLFVLPHPNFSAAACSTARSRSFFRFFRRNSSGSIPTAAARSSMCDSRAK